jgi:hypothetical protein
MESPFDDIAMARAVIEHYENMIECWKETLWGHMKCLEHAGDEEHSGEERYEVLVEETKGDWHDVDWAALVRKDEIQRELEGDVTSAMRYMKCLEDEDDESDS